MAWATPEEATGYLGVSVDQAQLDVAQPIIDIFSGRTIDVATTQFKARDLYLLKLAVSYQAKWMAKQIDVLNRVDVTNVTQDGMSFQNVHADSQILAPLAKRALDKLSWRKTRTLRPRTARRRSASLYTNEDCLPWSPIR